MPKDQYFSGVPLYTNGAFLQPLQVEIEGVEKWVWIVEEFEGECYVDGYDATFRAEAPDRDSLILSIDENN